MILLFIMVFAVSVALFVFFWAFSREFMVLRDGYDKKVVFRGRKSFREKVIGISIVVLCFLFLVSMMMFVGYEIRFYNAGIVREAIGDANMFNAGRVVRPEQARKVVENVELYNSLVYRGKEKIGLVYDGLFTQRFSELEYLRLNQELLSKILPNG